MSLKYKEHKLKSSESKKDLTATQKRHLPTESTFLNSNNSSRAYNQNISKVVKVVHKMEKNINQLKKACDIPTLQNSLSSSKERSKGKLKTIKLKQTKNKTVSQLQELYKRVHNQSTDNIEKLHRFYKQYCAPRSSSSSSNKSQACRMNKRKTVQDIKTSEPLFPFKLNSFGSRRGSDAEKNNPPMVVNDFMRSQHMKTQLSTKHLRLSDANDFIKQRSIVKCQNKQEGSSKKKIKSILKKSSFNPNFEQLRIKTSTPSIYAKESEVVNNKTRNGSVFKSLQVSPVHSSNLNRQKGKECSSKIRVVQNKIDYDRKLKNLKKSDTSRSKNKETETKKKKSALKLSDIDQLSPISNSSFRQLVQKLI